MLFLHLDYLTCLGTFSRSGSWWMGSSQQPSNTSPVSICSAPGGLSVSFLLSLKTGPQRLQATFSSMRMWCVCGRGHSKGHSKYISGLSCAVETQLRNHKQGSAEVPAFPVRQWQQTPLQGHCAGATTETKGP